MPVTTYTVIEGEVVSQNQNGTIHDFLPDPLGHTLGLIATDESIEFEWDYFPYDQVPTVWDSATPLRYGGTRGYHSDSYSRPHVGARELRTVFGRWMQVDPIWPSQGTYSYADARPVSHLDPSGMQVFSNLPYYSANNVILCGGGQQGGYIWPVDVHIPSLCSSPGTCKPYGGFPGSPHPVPSCIESGIRENCKGSSLHATVLYDVLRCVSWAENSDSMGGKQPPYGMFQIGGRGEKCNRKYPMWRTDSCQNAKCAAMLLCDCLRRGTGEIGNCGTRGNVFGGPKDYLLFEVINTPKQNKFCECMRGCGYPGAIPHPQDLPLIR